ncbi:unnamed protein product [Pieris macdunnoughi]|uniref:poly(ADP-ribose) glycohydrolase n=1 Tax=Pieris macdunnoughi TaxID=345717 RepID=A0A821N8D5_9NEOP|nr:unnamed protein product [Pieris macdunnoughi]
MALVMLPCDLPWWTSVQRHLKHLLVASSSTKLTASMLKIHDMCNIGIDPDDDIKDPDLLKGFEQFLEQELSDEERANILDNTIRIMVNRALHLKKWRPPKGLVFSLQQQSDVTELDYNLVSSLIAHAFFSTFPKRTLKTHPTLQDFNFTHFFKNLHRKSQRNKLKSLLHYFEWLDKNSNEGSIKLSRQVLTSRQWLTIEDWLHMVRHEGRPERCENDDAIRVCFSSSRIGGDVLIDGESQETLSMFMMPELLPAMLSVEALEDNEVLKVEGVRMFSRISDRKSKANIELLSEPKTVNVCLMDAEDYSALPASQWEEDNILRELNKSLLAFHQSPTKTRDSKHDRRLSPIGESFSLSPTDVEATVMIKQASSCSTINSVNSRSPSPQNYCAATLNLNDPSLELQKQKCWLSPDAGTLNNRRGRFIVLGSSGECLPVTRNSGLQTAETQEDSLYSSCNSSDDEFHSANSSFDDGSEDEGRGESGRPNSFQYSKELSTEERRLSFASRLRDALKREAETSCTTSTTGDWSTDSSSYAVGVSISGAEVNDNDIRVKRGGSVGFVLTEEETVENRKPPRRLLSRKETGNSSKYSFSTEYTSELEEVYEQFNHWLNDPIVDSEGDSKNRELDSRDLALNELANKIVSGGSCKPVATGNWGCGSRQRGHPQLKLLLQWLAASVAGVPALFYYTFGNENLFKLDTLVRVLVDRKWTVGQLARAMLKFSRQYLHEHHVIPDNHTLFDELIGIEKIPDDD